MPRQQKQQRPRHGAANSLRIIGGQWRSRKLQFESAAGLRPSGDRVRETLFNWLTPHIAGARCLDLFAGSGALGIEALSRGATECDFVEMHAGSARQIAGHLNTLGANNGRVHTRDALSFLQQGESRYHIAFVDPPFHEGLIDTVALQLDVRLCDDALIYIECASDESPRLPPHWQEWRCKRSGDVRFGLWQRRKCPAER